MDRAERRGLGLAVAGHVVLFALLSLNLMTRAHKVPPVETMDVELVDKIGLRPAAPKPSIEAPQQSTAPEKGPSEEAPAPTSAPAAKPEPAPPKPAPAPEPKPTLAPPAPAPKPKPAPAKPAPAHEKLSSDILKGLSDAPSKKTKATGSKLGPDFLKGLSTEKVGGKASRPRAVITGAQVASIGSAIAAQIRPCYARPTGGAGSDQIVSVLHLRFNRDGSLTKPPTIDSNEGVTPENQAYVRQMNDAAIRAVIRCAPLHLPPELYEGGWQDIISSFRSRDLG